jgi:hypothetical protein
LEWIEWQQLLAREFLAHHSLAAQVKPNQMKDCLAEIDTDRVFHGMPPPFTSYTPAAGWLKAADHPISNPKVRIADDTSGTLAALCQVLRRL